MVAAEVASSEPSVGTRIRLNMVGLLMSQWAADCTRADGAPSDNGAPILAQSLCHGLPHIKAGGPHSGLRHPFHAVTLKKDQAVSDRFGSTGQRPVLRTPAAPVSFNGRSGRLSFFVGPLR